MTALRNLAPQRTLRAAIAVVEQQLCAATDEREARRLDELLLALDDLSRALPERLQVHDPVVPHQAPKPAPDLAAMQEEWIRKNGNPRVPVEVRALASAIGDIDL